MSYIGTELGDAVRNGICQVLGAGRAIDDFFRNLADPTDPTAPYRSRLFYSNYCDAPPPPPATPPFEGGQCEFCYDVTVNFTVTGSSNPALDGPYVSRGFLWGPIGGYRLVRLGSPGSLSESGNFTFQCHGFCGLPYGPRQESGLGPFSIDTQSVVTVNNVLVSPRDGQPDACGSPPPEPPPNDPNARKFPIDLDFTYNDGSDFDITGNVFFGLAYFDTDFNVNVPLRFVLDNNVSFTGNLNLTGGDINFNFGDDFDYPSPPPPEGDYRPDPNDPPPPPSAEPPPPGFEPPYPPPNEVDPTDPEDFDDDEPQQAETVRRIIGVLVDTVQPPKMPTQINQDDNPIVFAPDIGLVNFGYVVGGNRFYWGEDIRVKNRRQVIFTPEGRYAAEVRGTIRQGGEWVLTPLYARVPVESVGG